MALSEKKTVIKNILVSVVIPVYNGAGYIKKALDSVLIQQIPLEIIIVDDCSTDHLMKVLEPYLTKPRIRLIRNKHNIGPAGSRNRGIRVAKGKYIAFLDCDDWWEPDKLKKQLKLMRHTGCVLCASGRRLVTPDGEPTKQIIGVKTHLVYRDLLFQNPINCSSVIITKEVAVEFPMVHDDCHEDYIMWLKILQKYRKACAVNEPLLNYRTGTSGKSGNKLKSAKMTFKVYRYMGFDMIKSLLCFIAYTINGFRKYYIHK